VASTAASIGAASPRSLLTSSSATVSFAATSSAMWLAGDATLGTIGVIHRTWPSVPESAATPNSSALLYGDVELRTYPTSTDQSAPWPTADGSASVCHHLVASGMPGSACNWSTDQRSRPVAASTTPISFEFALLLLSCTTMESPRMTTESGPRRGPSRPRLHNLAALR
jgi:hypothetical protein